jgi:hypothetical protein
VFLLANIQNDSEFDMTFPRERIAERGLTGPFDITSPSLIGNRVLQPPLPLLAVLGMLTPALVLLVDWECTKVPVLGNSRCSASGGGRCLDGGRLKSLAVLALQARSRVLAPTCELLVALAELD